MLFSQMLHSDFLDGGGGQDCWPNNVGRFATNVHNVCVSTSCGSNEIVSRSQVNPATIILIAILS